MADNISVLIVDDHPLVREGIRNFLNAVPDIDVVAEAESGQAAVEHAEAHAPDVVLLDLVLKGMLDGVAVARQIRDLSPRTRIIMLTSFHDDKHVFPAMRAGALSYLLKSIEPEKMVEAIRCAVRGEATLDPAVAATLVSELGSDVIGDDPVMRLSDRELEVLHCIAAGDSNAEIARKFSVSVKTVRCHVSNVLSKLHLRDRTQLAVYAWSQGVVKA